MLQERVWFILCMMMVLPFIFPLIMPQPFSMFAMIGVNLLLLFVIRKNFKTMTGKIMGNNTKLVCAVCGKSHNKDSCPRCGSRQRRLG